MQRQKGFSAVEVILIVVVIIVLGAAGWYVWKNVGDSNDSDNSSNSETTQQAEQEEQPAEPAIEDTLYSEVPSDLQAAIFDETQQKAPGCTKDGQIVDFNGDPYDQKVVYASNGLAITGIGCDGGSVYLFAEHDGVWMSFASTQGLFKCSTLETHNVPTKLLELGVDTEDPTRCAPEDPSAPAEYYQES